MQPLKNKKGPDLGDSYLQYLGVTRKIATVNMHRATIHHFDRFLSQFKIEIKHLQVKHIIEFDEHLERHLLTITTRQLHLKNLNLYLRWIERQGHIKDGATKVLFPDYRQDFVFIKQAILPPIAEEFINVIGTINKPKTVSGYKSCLRGFYSGHDKTKKRPHDICREDIERYMLYLKERGLKINIRIGRLLQIRRYIYWLNEKGKLKIDPDRIISQRDFPRREDSLPKPFPLDVDIEIQRRLKASNDIDKLGILLMRRTGLRIGELRNLTSQCLKEGLDENHYLKVPLGKLNNERVIPLDPETVELINRIKSFHSLIVDKKMGEHYLISGKNGQQRCYGHMSAIFVDVTKGISITGRANLHRLRHTYATTLLSAGMSIVSIKTLLGHRDIRMTLGYAAVTQESLRNEYFTALAKIEGRYEITNYKLKTTNLKQGVSRAFYDTAASIKKFVKEHGDQDSKKTNRLLYRLNMIRHEVSIHLNLDQK